VLVLGIDGMDPTLLDRYMARGLLPHFAQLRDQGLYTRLGTTTPPESPVAWSTFATGCNPGQHGLFDFIQRAPHSYAPDSTLLHSQDGRLVSPRQGTPFWTLTSTSEVPTTVLRVPITFPPEAVHGCLLAGMGVPDIAGTQGMATYWTTATTDESLTFRGHMVPVVCQGQHIDTVLYGPPRQGTPPALTVPLHINLHPERQCATLTVQGQEITLQVGEWSPWFRVAFSRGWLDSLTVIGRFYLQSVSPTFALYGSPLQYDPLQPPVPISHPPEYAHDLAQAIGLYSTLGMPEDTSALNNGWLDDAAFLQHCQAIHAERQAMLWHAMEHWQDGLLVLVFDTLDRIQHMFWRFIDPQHPLYAADSPYANVIETWYRDFDTLLGKVQQRLEPETILIVLSDHGFANFRRVVHLNAWLKSQGLLRLKEGCTSGRMFGQDVDWEHTQAYALGIGGIYLNRQGREPRGIVPPEAAGPLLHAMQTNLLTLTDPQTGAPVVRRVLRSEEVYTGSQTTQAPDLFVGFADGYRASWETAAGGTPEVLIEDNRRKWSGDHIVDPDLVPGILLMNRRMPLHAPTLQDMAPTILHMVGVATPPTWDGTSFWPEPLPVASVAAPEPVVLPAVDAVSPPAPLAPEDEAMILQRLVGLGYIDPGSAG
jgi:predicted AlkP superfamily phosphohydrolase/phosphomutase